MRTGGSKQENGTAERLPAAPEKKTKSRSPSTDTRVGEDCYVVD
jgi:hypothetical protein